VNEKTTYASTTRAPEAYEPEGHEPPAPAECSADEVLVAVLDLAIAAPLALGAFTTVSSVEWSDGVTTACVECTHRPRLLLNRAFVAEHCTTSERVAMLVLHELSHISLGHTRLYPRVTPAQNVAFDAVINARLLHLLLEAGIDPAPYAALPCGLYGAAEAPLFILRPPPGWPAAPEWHASATCPEPLRNVHRRLYSLRRKRLDDVTYGELLAALRASCSNAEIGAAAARLLGGHGATALEEAALSGGRDPGAAELLSATMVALDDRGLGAGPAASRETLRLPGGEPEYALQRALRRLLRQVFAPSTTAYRRLTSRLVPLVGVDPSRDRRAATRKLLARAYGAPEPMLFRVDGTRHTPHRSAATIYIDVSGSMTELIDRLHAALVPLRRMLAPEVLAFSCGVMPTPVARFVDGEMDSTWGTEIEPVLTHAAERARRAGPGSLGPRRALVLTDGYFDRPGAAAVRALVEARAELHFGIIGDGPLPEGRWVASATRLPHYDDETETTEEVA
jgi:hypothetical protein